MRLLGIPVGQLTAENIEGLVREQVPESRRLDYKRDVPTDDAGKADLVSDVCAFANTDGGVILFGIDERDPENVKTGKAQTIVGIDGTADRAILRLTQALASKITPSIGPLLRFQEVALDSNRIVLALGIAQSYARPHREENKHRYFLRNDGAKYEPDVMETRRMFLESESWTDEAEAFVGGRLRALRFSRLCIPYAVVHVLPLGRLRSRSDISQMYDRIGELMSPDGGSLKISPNLDGVCGQRISHRTADVIVEQVQVFRFGGVEFASARAVGEDMRYGNRIYGELLTQQVRAVIRNAVRELTQTLGLDAPFVLSLGLIAAEGYTLTMGSSPMSGVFRVSEMELQVPSVVCEAGSELDASIRQLTDVLWEAVGARDPYWPQDDR